MDSNNALEEERYQEALSFLFSQLPMFQRVGAAAYKPGLDTSLRLDAYFGHPHRRFRSIHIGGTNGKGSTSHTLAAMLQAQGYKTALYTSPHLADFRERMRINGKMIPRRDVIDFVDRWRRCDYKGHPSFFELTMMMAFDWFAREEVDYAVIEVGMGGRLDSTNIITPLACVITNISPDHMQFLGDTLPKIASEKAGIIKSGIPVVIGESEGEIREVFARKAAEVGAPIRYADSEKALLGACEGDGSGWDCTGRLIDPEAPERETAFHAELSGDYQLANINTALCAADMLRKAGIDISEDSEKAGFAEVQELTGLAGRWMRLGSNPDIICDTGHNEAGIRYNMGQLQRLMSRKGAGARLRMVMGFVSDKDVDHIASLLPRDCDYYLTRASVQRAMPEDELQKKLRGCGIEGRTYPDVKSALAAAKREASASDIIYVGGSTFIVADALS